MQSRTIYINLQRNEYMGHPEYQEMLKRLFTGQEFTFARSFEGKTIA